MTVETKYNIGNEVRIKDNFLETIKVKVYGIFAEVKGSNTLIDYYVGFYENSCVVRKEELLFPSK